MFWDGKSINLPPIFGWGGLIGAAPPNLQFPGWLNVNHTQDVAGSLTKIVGRHTIKAGATSTTVTRRRTRARAASRT